ncbi:sugar transporter-like protein [Dinothrombium tinctorium]|uniref:Sugar transporter-like protein n=1 Tax=Dinothrombium tinctorium TaxID=1965070 RepID=A0A443QKF3_9ACAR|nr:sugar transporter-like protein [Dinothrombium tinctorium]
MAGNMTIVWLLSLLLRRIGRIPTIALGYSIAGIAGLLTNFTSEHYTLFVAARAVLGAATPAMMVPLVISKLFYFCPNSLIKIVNQVAEFIGPKHRFISILGLFLTMYTCGGVLPWIAYAIGKWRTYNLITSSCFFLVPLLSILLYTMIFAGHNIFVANLSKHPFMMLSVFAGFDCVAAVLSRFVADFYGRRKSMCFACFLSAILYSITVFIPKDRLIIAVAFSARMGITALMNINAVYSSEIFPTVARSRLSSVRMCISSFGTAFSPILVSFQFFGSNTPLFLFGILVAVCGFLMLPMPETLGKPLPETFEDAEKLNIKSNESQKENNESDDILLQKV